MALSEKTATQKRIYYLDILRVIACFFVIMCHTSGEYVVRDFGSLNFWVGDLLDSLCRVASPLFIMISGALMLDENYAYSTKKIKQHIIKMAVFFVFWSALYSVWFEVIQPIRHGTAVSAQKIIEFFVQGPYHFWFVFLIVGIYAIVPLLRLWVKKENEKSVRYFIILAMIFAFALPQIIDIGKQYSDLFVTPDTIIGYLRLDYVAGYTAYYLLGWYINNFEIKNRYLVYGAGALSFAATFFGTYVIAMTTGRSSLMFNNLSLTVFMQTAAVFLFFKSKYRDSRKSNRIIGSISKYSLGIYAVHVFFLEASLIILTRFNIGSALIEIPAIFIASVVLSFLASALLGKIPFLKKFVI